MGSGINNKINECLCNPKDVKKRNNDLKMLRSRKYSHCLFENIFAKYNEGSAFNWPCIAVCSP